MLAVIISASAAVFLALLGFIFRLGKLTQRLNDLLALNLGERMIRLEAAFHANSDSDYKGDDDDG